VKERTPACCDCVCLWRRHHVFIRTSRLVRQDHKVCDFFPDKTRTVGRQRFAEVFRGGEYSDVRSLRQQIARNRRVSVRGEMQQLSSICIQLLLSIHQDTTPEADKRCFSTAKRHANGTATLRPRLDPADASHHQPTFCVLAAVIRGFSQSPGT